MRSTLAQNQRSGKENDTKESTWISPSISFDSQTKIEAKGEEKWKNTVGNRGKTKIEKKRKLLYVVGDGEEKKRSVGVLEPVGEGDMAERRERARERKKVCFV